MKKPETERKGREVRREHLVVSLLDFNELVWQLVPVLLLYVCFYFDWERVWMIQMHKMCTS